MIQFDYMRYFVGFLIMIGLAFIGILLLVRLLFGGGGNQVEKPKSELVSNVGTSKTVELFVDGPINANLVHTQVKIAVGTTQTTVQLLSGYEGTVVKSESYANNAESYASFLRALDIVGYTNGSDDKNLKDERGFCPLGRRNVFQIKDGAQTLQRYWSTSCGKSAQGNFNGDSTTTLRLFRDQIPDYNAFTRGLKGYDF